MPQDFTQRFYIKARFDASCRKCVTQRMKNSIPDLPLVQVSLKFVLHCFSSGKDLCWTGLDLDGYISLSGIITFKNAEDLRNIVKNVPLNRILLETDSPFLAPTPFRGKINEPCHVKDIANYLVDFLKIDFNIIQENTTKNFLRLFSKVNYGS